MKPQKRAYVKRILSGFSRLAGGHLVGALLTKHLTRTAFGKFDAATGRGVAFLARLAGSHLACGAFAEHFTRTPFSEETGLVAAADNLTHEEVSFCMCVFANMQHAKVYEWVEQF